MKSQTPVFRRVTVLLLLLFLLSYLPASPVHAAMIRFVVPEGTGTCSNWEDACDLQTALAADGWEDVIWVAEGTYYPTQTTDRTATFRLTNMVSVYGGFTGNEHSLDQRDWKANVTVLSGDIGIPGDVSDNSYHVVTGEGSAALDGFTIEKGNASRIDYPDGEGGGIKNEYSNINLSNLIIANNMGGMGGGLFNLYSSPTLHQVTFSGNSAYIGGGIYNGNSYPELSSVTFVGNTATRGGGIYNSDSSPTITNSTFYGNTAEKGGGMWNYYHSYPVLTYTTFAGNSATTTGAAIGNDFYYASSNYYYVYDSIFWGNTAPTGNQIDYDSSLETYVFDHSVVQGYSGALPVITDDPKLGPLGDYGGSTQTIPLLEGSSAIDTGDCSFLTNEDQRGATRPQGYGCDIGAFEYAGIIPPLVDTTPPQVDTFTIPATSNESSDIPIYTFTASDNVGVVAYLITKYDVAPDKSNPWWTAQPPTTFSVVNGPIMGGIEGIFTMYPWVKDANGNVSSAFPHPPSIRIDSVPPVVENITLLDYNPSDQSSVRFLVTFSEPVMGVDVSDLLLQKTGGITGESITNITGGPTDYTVTVSTGNGSGSLWLVVPSSATAVDWLDNPLDNLPFYNGEVYVVDRPYVQYFPWIVR